MEEKNILEDDAKEKVFLLVERRIPWLAIGLIGGMVIALFASRFENILSTHISLAYFIPVIVYMASAVGSQTETIYIRNVGKEKVNFWESFFKEGMLGIALGALFGVILGGFSFVWFHSLQTALTIGLSAFFTIAIAPLIALCVSALLHKEGKDPAIGAGPFMTIIQDMITLLLYFIIASVIITV